MTCRLRPVTTTEGQSVNLAVSNINHNTCNTVLLPGFLLSQWRCQVLCHCYCTETKSKSLRVLYYWTRVTWTLLHICSYSSSYYLQMQIIETYQIFIDLSFFLILIADNLFIVALISYYCTFQQKPYLWPHLDLNIHQQHHAQHWFLSISICWWSTTCWGVLLPPLLAERMLISVINTLTLVIKGSNSREPQGSGFFSIGHNVWFVVTYVHNKKLWS